MWYKVRLCDACKTIVMYKNENSWITVSGKISNKFCTFCGGEHSSKTEYTAKWISNTVWYNPLTWFTGEFILREDYLGQEEMKTKLAKVRKPVNLPLA